MKSGLDDLLTTRRFSRRALMGGTAASAAVLALHGLADPRLSFAASGKEFHCAWPYDPPPKGNFNLMQGASPESIMGPPNIYADLIVEPFAMYYWASGDWLPLLATEWSFQNGDTFTVNMRKGAKWSDGNEVTSKDVLTTFWCARLLSNSLWDYIDKIEAPDDYTVNFHMSKPSTVVQRYVLRFNTMSDVTYGSWAKKIEDLYNSGKTVADPEGKQLLQQFTNFQPPDVIANGPFKIDVSSITQAQFTLPKNETSWNADKVPFDRMINFNGETPVITPVVLAKNVDYATHGFPPATEKAFEAEGIRIIRPPTYSGPALFINYNKLGHVFNDARVRQAIAMAVNRAQNGTVSLGESGVGVKYMAGFSDTLVPQWMAQADVSELNTYDYDQDKATSLLQEAGWKKGSDGVWAAKDGTKAAFELIFPAEFADWSASGQDLSDQLNKFGFKITPRAVTYTQEPVNVDKGDFELAIQGWGSSTSPHPQFAYVADLFTHNYIIAINNGGRGMDFPLKQQTSSGAVDLQELVINSALGLDQNAQKANVAKIAKAFNELLPIIPLFERLGNNAVLENVRVKPWPPDGDPIYKNSFYADGIVTMLMYTGKLQPV